MRFKELALWLFFLILCFGAGFLKGHGPVDAGSTLLGDPAEVEILITDEIFLPSEIRLELQKKLKIKIKTLIVHDREEFTIRTITSPGYHLALIPDHWIGPANLAHQMSNISPLMDLMTERISSDFLKTSQEKIYSAPLFWMVTSLRQVSPTEPNPTGKKFYLLGDWDELTTKVFELKLDSKQVQPVGFFQEITDPAVKLDSHGIYEVSHLNEATLKKTNPADYKYTSLYLWSLCSPRHSPSRKLTLKLIEALTEPDLQLRMLANLPLATTLKNLDQASLPRSRKALFIRDLDLSHLKKPQSISLERLNQVKNEYLVH